MPRTPAVRTDLPVAYPAWTAVFGRLLWAAKEEPENTDAGSLLKDTLRLQQFPPDQPRALMDAIEWLESATLAWRPDRCYTVPFWHEGCQEAPPSPAASLVDPDGCGHLYLGQVTWEVLHDLLWLIPPPCTSLPPVDLLLPSVLYPEPCYVLYLPSAGVRREWEQYLTVFRRPNTLDGLDCYQQLLQGALECRQPLPRGKIVALLAATYCYLTGARVSTAVLVKNTLIPGCLPFDHPLFYPYYYYLPALCRLPSIQTHQLLAYLLPLRTAQIYCAPLDTGAHRDLVRSILRRLPAVAAGAASMFPLYLEGALGGNWQERLDLLRGSTSRRVRAGRLPLPVPRGSPMVMTTTAAKAAEPLAPLPVGLSEPTFYQHTSTPAAASTGSLSPDQVTQWHLAVMASFPRLGAGEWADTYLPDQAATVQVVPVASDETRPRLLENCSHDLGDFDGAPAHLVGTRQVRRWLPAVHWMLPAKARGHVSRGLWKQRLSLRCGKARRWRSTLSKEQLYATIKGRGVTLFREVTTIGTLESPVTSSGFDLSVLSSLRSSSATASGTASPGLPRLSESPIEGW